MRHRLRLIIFPLLAAFALTAAGSPGNSAGGGMPVEVRKVQIMAFDRMIEAVGTLDSDESVVIRPEIAGIITKILFREGQPVKQGAPMIKIDDSIYRAELTEAQANGNLAAANYERAQSLYKKQTGTARALDEARAALDAGKAQVALAQARMAKTVITAPFGGVAGLKKISVGDYVTPGQDIVNLEKIDTLKADFRIAEVNLPLVKAGQTIKVGVDAVPGRVFEGKVAAIDPRIDAAGRSVVIRASIPNTDGLLRPGLFARINLVLENRAGALAVPEEAILPQGDKKSVYRVVDGKVAPTPVETGQRRGGMVEIVKGLSAGDTVITAGQMKVQPGMPVTAIPVQ